MNYGKLFGDEGGESKKSELREALTQKVLDELEELKSYDLADKVAFSKLPEFVDQHITKGVPEYLLLDFIEGKRIDEFCAECEGSPCCTENDPIALSYDDVRRLAKGFGRSSKYVIKQYLTHYNPIEIPSVSYRIKKANPCQWLSKSKDKDYCTIYDSRPNVCRIYPLSLRLGKAKSGKIEIVAGVSSYCNVAFNMMKLGIKRMAIRESFRIQHPEECAALEAEAASILPTQKGLESMGQMDRARLLRTANETFFNGISRLELERKEESKHE